MLIYLRRYLSLLPNPPKQQYNQRAIPLLEWSQASQRRRHKGRKHGKRMGHRDRMAYKRECESARYAGNRRGRNILARCSLQCLRGNQHVLVHVPGLERGAELCGCWPGLGGAIQFDVLRRKNVAVNRVDSRHQGWGVMSN